MRSWVQSLVLGQLVFVNHKSLANKHVVSQSEPPLSHPVFATKTATVKIHFEASKQDLRNAMDHVEVATCVFSG